MVGRARRVSGFFLGSLGRLASAAALVAGLAAGSARADEVQVAVAGNFAPTLQKLTPLFTARTGHTVVQSTAASGQLLALIANGAPFQVFLSADSERPKELEDKGLAVKGTRFVYAEGRLVLWSPKPDRVDPGGAVLTKPDLGVIALADPRVAPYGAAAERVLRAKKLWDKLRTAQKLSLGTSITQAHQFVSTGNADVGFVALSQVRADDGNIPGSSWIIPKEQAGPIRQEAVLLGPGAESGAAQQLLTFIKSSPEARAVIEAAGYELPPIGASGTAGVKGGGMRGPRSAGQAPETAPGSRPPEAAGVGKPSEAAGPKPDQQGPANTRPAEGGANTRPAEGGANTRPAEGGANTRPAEGGANNPKAARRPALTKPGARPAAP
jgi:molybdate transport system substrate-binding protein